MFALNSFKVLEKFVEADAHKDFFQGHLYIVLDMYYIPTTFIIINSKSQKFC